MKKYVLIILLCLSTKNSFSVVNDQSNKQNNNKINNELFINNTNLDSIFSVVTIPFDSTNIFLMGLYHLDQNQPESAIYYFGELLKEETDSLVLGELLYYQSLAYYNLDNIDSAFMNLKKSVVFNDYFKFAHSNLSSIYLEKGYYKDALEHSNRALELDSNYADAWNNRAGALIQLNFIDSAEIAYLKAIEIKPDFKKVWFNLGIIKINSNEFEEAVRCYNKALEIDNRFVEAWIKLAEISAYVGDSLMSFSYYDTAIIYADNPWYPWSQKSMLHQIMGNHENALLCIDSAIVYGERLSKSDKFLWYLKAYSLSVLFRYPECIEACDSVLKYDPYNQDAYLMRKDALNRMGVGF